MSRTTLWNCLSRISAPSRRQSAPKFARRPAVEGLEDRKLMAVVTDLADAAILVGHGHPGTHLYINFDGGSAPLDFSGKNFATIRAFETEAGDGALNRERDIQDILFKVAEVYSPFDVRVERINGAGAYSTDSGDTTVFVGANNNNATASLVGSSYKYTKYAYSFTPGAFTDAQQIGHELNSDPYDVALIDTVVGSTTSVSNILASLRTQTLAGNQARGDVTGISQAITHESSHTFGLSHVRTDGLFDANAAVGKGSVNDVQSYDSPNIFFANQNLNLTSANNTGTSLVYNLKLPTYHDAAANQDVTLVTQNSYRTLGKVLGYRSLSLGASVVADPATVDPIARRPILDESNGTNSDDSIIYSGDHQVFHYTPAATAAGNAIGYDKITVRAYFGDLRPEILVYDATGVNLIQVVKPSGGVATLTSLTAGTTYTIVIGAVDGQTTGNYYTTFEHHSIFTDTVSDHAPYHVELGPGVHTTVTSTVTTVGLNPPPSVHTGITSTVTSAGLNTSVIVPAATPGTSLDPTQSYTLDPTTGLPVVEQPIFVKPLKPFGPIVATAEPVAVPADDLTVVVDTTAAADSIAVAVADPSTPPIDEPPVDASAGPGLVAMATDAALDILASPPLDALALAQVIDGTSLLDPNVTSVPSGV